MLLTGAVFSAVAAAGANAQGDGELAKDLVNPFTTLVLVPMELDYDKQIGPVNGGKAYSLNILPVIPIPT